MEEKILEECALYFRKNKAYTRMFIEMKKKYIKYGKLSGKIFLENLSEAECSALSAVFGRSLLPGDFSISVSQLQAALNETKYCGVELEALVEKYFNEKILSNSQKKDERTELNKRFWDAVLHEAGSRFGKDAKGILWLNEMREQRKYGYQRIIREREKSRDGIKEVLMEVCNALAYLQQREGDRKENVRLAVLGAEITKNPHYFDRQNAAGRLLISALSFTYKIEEPKAQEGVLALYYMAGIAPDDISSYTTCYGIHFYEGDSEHEAYQYFIRKGEKYVLTLSNLSRLARADSSRKTVFIIENQMVFSQVCEEMRGEEYSIVCTSGQLRTASLFLIDLLLKSGCKLYYCGDIDPEGIEIADRVIERGSGQIFPWRMTREDYYRSISKDILAEKRLKRLDKIGNVQLRELAKLLKAEKKAGYQEQLIDLMVEDIKAVK
ncbi:TIGR02679 domain-containing protein [Sporofaciens musculi]|uniref:TIGR02679 domain-containing protein n=3 Tax=Sporofaciens musculi TaxID=2681861 RepID=UPI00258C0C6B|nr:TIGR02679 domain-containing protein [Sporofaciens musculi]